ncbi:tetratricopeptide repeat protein [Aurantiacibacter sp. D1-12]|uniref:tetratricopeptide repeat protein n=1 Tax=Aurantiacibacter sp. D1-12 TaxID=2993658 RepID=UPI00237D01E0|nr:tetratricopeptide repeat protein [Aurantiacibacter sp. D1-12]MDE1466941.1 tetratricopeptide repeat protein [Aurantiacibacter sp. D1-12]
MKRSRSYFCVLLTGAASLAITSVGAGAVQAQEVVQALPSEAQGDLSNALQRLSRNPTNLRALVDAGNASLELGDYDGALGFFNRAQRVDPNDGGMLLGLAQVAVRRGEGATAVQLFTNAENAGERMNRVAAERGLAYDLVGNHARAQRYYRQALSQRESNEVIRRLALSYAIAGDAAASEATLLPLLQRQDRAAYRTRAFALAILGRDEEAIAITETMLPARLSGRLEPYLRYMPRLTSAQQAAAANLGRFPQASQIGRDTPQVAALANSRASTPPTATPAQANNDRLTPSGEPLGPRSAATLDENGELPALAAADTPAVEQANLDEPTGLPDVAVSEVGQSPSPAASEPEAVVVAVLDEEADFPPEEQARPSFSISEPVVQTPADPSVEEVIAATEERTAEQLGLEEAFADFVLPAGNTVAPSAGAVDITTIEPAREEPEPVEPPPPAHPSRHWVQVATGQDISAFRFDWRRLQRNSDGLLEDRDAFTAPWNATNRLVTGPFDSARAAQNFVSELAEAGIDAFRFTSSEGEEVRPLD